MGWAVKNELFIPMKYHTLQLQIMPPSHEVETNLSRSFVSLFMLNHLSDLFKYSSKVYIIQRSLPLKNAADF